MRSLFWRFFCYLWLALILVISLTFTLTKIVNQDRLIKNWHPAFNNLAEDFFQVYQTGDKRQLKKFLKEKYNKHHLYLQVLNDEGEELISYKSKHHKIDKKLSNLRQLNQEVSFNGENYLFVYRIAQDEINKWQRQNLIWLILLVIVGLVILTLISFLLTFSIANPLNKLRLAVNDLENNNYHQQKLIKLLKRHDEIGVLAQDFNKMGLRIQQLITNQRRLLRDVSHELRSPLARLKIITSLFAQISFDQKDELKKLQNKANLECVRLDKLIDEILMLARLEEQKKLELNNVNLFDVFGLLIDDLLLTYPKQKITLNCPDDLTFNTDQDLLLCALGNLLNNAFKFNCSNLPTEVNVICDLNKLKITIRDFGLGVKPEFLSKLGEPFFRTCEQNVAGNGLGLAITKRVIKNLGGDLHFTNAENCGFVAVIIFNV